MLESELDTCAFHCTSTGNCRRHALLVEVETERKRRARMLAAVRVPGVSHLQQEEQVA